MASDGPASHDLHPDTLRRLRDVIAAGDQNVQLLAGLRQVEASISRVVEAAHGVLSQMDPAALDKLLDMVMAAQRRDLAIPDGDGFMPRIQQLGQAWQAGTMQPDELALYERSVVAFNARTKLRIMHPELSQGTPPLDPDDLRLFRGIEQLGGALREAQAHMVPGDVTPEWLAALEHEVTRHRALLATTRFENTHRGLLCSLIAHACYALGRGRELLGRMRQAGEAYSEAARFHRDGGSPDSADAAEGHALRLSFAVMADIDGASIDDLRDLADGIADPLPRARALHRLALRAEEANDQAGAARHTEAAIQALAQAGFPDPRSGTIDAVMSGCIDAAASGRTGVAVARLLACVGEILLDILRRRHAALLTTDVTGARAADLRLNRFSDALLAALAQMDAVAAETSGALQRYIPGLALPDPLRPPGYDRANALWKRINVLLDATDTAPDTATVAEAAAIVTEANALGQPGLTANARLAQSRLLALRGDAAGSAQAAELGEAALLPDGAKPDSLIGQDVFWAFLMLRGKRIDAAAQSGAWRSVLMFAEDAISAIEAMRYRISDPFQQGGFLSERTRFYETAAFAAFKLERWDNLITVMDLFRSRSALRNRLAPPPDDEAGALMLRVQEITRQIEAAPQDQRQALRDSRQLLWSLLSVTQLRGAADQALPELSVAAVQAALAPDEALVSWMWIGRGVLIVLALDRTRVHGERIILTDDELDLLAEYVAAARLGEMRSDALGDVVETLTGALLPPAVREFIAGTKRLILSPHRTLHLLPFHASTIDGRFLIERMAVRYVPNVGSLLILWRGVRDGAVTAFGIDRFAGPGIPDLINAEAEAREIAAIWAVRGIPAEALTGEEATTTAFLQSGLDKCRCLHLATHGSSVFSGDNAGDPFASRLFFHDGYLEALSLAQLPLRAELVVLSACDSGQRALDLPGLGELPGDDIFGLQAALFQAGVHGVIGALWRLDDASARRIVPALHEQLAAGATAEAALCSAVRAYLGTPGLRRDVYFWAPLFLASIGRLADQTEENAR